MKAKQATALVLASVMGLGLLAGCGDSKKGGSETAKNDGDVVTLKWIQVGGSMPDNYDAWLKQINPYLEEWRLFHGQIGITEEVLSQTQEKISIFFLQTRHVTMQK